MFKKCLVGLVCSIAFGDCCHASCPLINGTFELPLPAAVPAAVQELVFGTTLRDGKYYYTVDREGLYHPADAKWRRVTFDGAIEAEIRFTCVGGSVLQEVKKVGSDKIGWKKITPLNGNYINIETNYPEKSGMYKRVR